MPVHIVEVPDVLTTTQKPIAEAVINNFLRNTGINNADIIFSDNLSNVHQPGSNIGEQHDGGDISFGNTERMYLEYEETRAEDTRISRKPGWHYERPFFLDTDFGIKLSPSMVMYDATVTLTRRAPSKAILTTWLNEISRRLDMGLEQFMTQAEYYFYIPIPCLNMIAACYRTMNTHVDYGITLAEYLRYGFSDSVTVVAGEGGIGSNYAVAMTANRISVQIEDNDPRPEKSNDSGTAWQASFTLKFTYARPEAVMMCYPYIINNAYMPAEWWQKSSAPGLNDETGAIGNVWVDANDFIINELPGIKLPVRVPNIDDPQLPTLGKGPSDVDFVSGDLIFNPDNSWIPDDDWKPSDPYPPEVEHMVPAKMFNMTEIEGIDWSESFVAYVRKCIAVDPSLKTCVVYPRIYEDGGVISASRITVDNDLNVYVDFIPKLLSRYRFSVGIRLNWGSLSNEEFDDLRQNPDFVQDVIKDFFPDLVEKYPVLAEPGLDKLPASVLDGVCQDTAEIMDSNHPVKNPAKSSSTFMLNILNGRIMTYKESR